MVTRKFESGYSKFQRKKEFELFVESQNGVMDKFIKIKRNELSLL